MTFFLGSSSGARLEQANFMQSKKEILETGMISEREFEEAMKLTDDPEWARISPLMVSAWGRKP